MSDRQMVCYSNAIWIPDYNIVQYSDQHLNTRHLNTGQVKVCYSDVPLFRCSLFKSPLYSIPKAFLSSEVPEYLVTMAMNFINGRNINTSCYQHDNTHLHGKFIQTNRANYKKYYKWRNTKLGHFWRKSWKEKYWETVFLLWIEKIK